jgi:hypothetical protein
MLRGVAASAAVLSLAGRLVGRRQGPRRLWRELRLGLTTRAANRATQEFGLVGTQAEAFTAARRSFGAIVHRRFFGTAVTVLHG